MPYHKDLKSFQPAKKAKSGRIMPENIWNSICAMGEPEMRYHGTARMFIPWKPGMERSSLPVANVSMNC